MGGSVAFTFATLIAMTLSASPTADRQLIALLIDTSAGVGDSLGRVRQALPAFVDALPPESELLVATTGRRVQIRVPPTSDKERLKKSIGGIVSDGGPTPQTGCDLRCGRAVHATSKLEHQGGFRDRDRGRYAEQHQC
jgi:hypothetical protein